MTATLMERPTPSRPTRAVRAPDAPRQHWCVVTCEYPPIDGGVSDHTRQLVATLGAQGDVVDVWCPPAPVVDDAEPALAPEIPGVTVHVLPSHFGLRAVSQLRR
jgi:hypothetical protein